MKQPNTGKNEGLLRWGGKYNSLLSRMLIIGVLLGPLAAAQADTWGFKLVGAPTALNKNSPKFESIRMTGGGTFDPLLGVVSACGTYTLYNAFDHPNGPVVHGIWHSTGFVSFTTAAGKHEDGKRNSVLTIAIASDDGLAGTGEMTVTADGIQGPIVAGEPYIIPPGGSGGGARFRMDDDDTFYPLPPL